MAGGTIGFLFADSRPLIQARTSRWCRPRRPHRARGGRGLDRRCSSLTPASPARDDDHPGRREIQRRHPVECRGWGLRRHDGPRHAGSRAAAPTASSGVYRPWVSSLTFADATHPAPRAAFARSPPADAVSPDWRRRPRQDLVSYQCIAGPATAASNRSRPRSRPQFADSGLTNGAEYSLLRRAFDARNPGEVSARHWRCLRRRRSIRRRRRRPRRPHGSRSPAPAARSAARQRAQEAEQCGCDHAAPPSGRGSPASRRGRDARPAGQDRVVSASSTGRRPRRAGGGVVKTTTKVRFTDKAVRAGKLYGRTASPCVSTTLASHLDGEVQDAQGPRPAAP